MQKRFVSHAIIICVMILLSGGFSTKLFAATAPQKSVKPEPVKQEHALSKTVTDAWKKAGARIKINWVDVYSDTNKKVALTQISFFGWPAADITQLPMPQKPFGFAFHVPPVGRVIYPKDKHLSQLLRFKNLQALNLEGPDITNAGLKTVGQIKNLGSLTLRCGKVNSIGLSELVVLKKLYSLDLTFARITGSELSKFPQLKKLDVFGTQMSDASLKKLRHLKNLRSLRIGRTKVSDAGLKTVAQFKNLQWLSLYDLKITDTGLKELVTLKKLQWLDLGGTKVTGKAIAFLCQKIPLSELSLSFCDHLTGADIEAILEKSRIQRLDLEECDIESLSLTKLPHLKTLSFENNISLTDVELIDCPQLKTVSFAYCGSLEGILFAKTPQLQELSLEDCPEFVDSQLIQLRNTNIQELNLVKVKITKAGAAAISQLKTLQTLNLSLTNTIDARLSKLSRLQNLRSLNLSHTKVSDLGIPHIAKMKKLRWLHIGYTKVTKAGEKKLEQLFPKCEVRKY